MSQFEDVVSELRANPRSWLITGVAGFIGSNLLEILLRLDQTVTGLDNFATGFRHNLDEVRNSVSEGQWKGFNFHEGDICDYAVCQSTCKDVDYVLHQAALGSVPRSIEDPIATNAANIDGFINIMNAARTARVKKFVYAASSSTYGDHPALPKVEENIGNPLSPYAVTKYVNELYADVFERCYQFRSIGLRYFNVFGKRQNPDGAYASVIPKWTAAMIKGKDVLIYGDGETSRDFCYIDNVVQMNLIAAVSQLDSSEVFNVAVNSRTSLNELFNLISTKLGERGHQHIREPIYRDFRGGDVRHSQADIGKAEKLLGYRPEFTLETGLDIAIDWHIDNL